MAVPVMPAILTHDFFGRDFYAANNALIGESPDARDAFLLAFIDFLLLFCSLPGVVLLSH